MANLSGFDAEAVEPSGSFEALPPGQYLAVITESEMAPTKAGTGSFLKLRLQVLEGQYKGRTLFDRLNLDNPNPQAVQIAKGTLSAICRAVGVPRPQDSTELHDLPLTIIVKTREYNGDTQNEIKGYKPKGNAPAAPTANTEKAPWD